MLRTGSLEQRVSHKVFADEKFHGLAEYMIESDEAACPGPLALLVTQDAGWTLPVHYHRQEQFQVVVSGSGSLGQHRLAPLTVHYASRDAAYGPIIAGQAGLQYLTLRAMTGGGVWYMPESRAMMSRRPKRHAYAGPFLPSEAKSMIARQEPAAQTAIEPDATGLAAWLVRLGPGQSMREPTHERGGGRSSWSLLARCA